MDTNKKGEDKPISYPHPTETDRQLQNQPEYIDQQPGDFSDKSISDLPANDQYEKQSNNPGSEEK